MNITIVRHGKPETLESGWISSADLEHWIAAYNTSPIPANSQPPGKLIGIADNCGGLVCSNLRRSVESAELLCRNKIILQSEIFAEAGLPYANRSIVKLPPKVWAALFRISWVLGYSNNSENRKQTQARAMDATGKLILLAESHRDIVYIGHGIFNRLVVRELLKKGWQGSRNPSSAHFGYTVYKKREQISICK